MKKIDIQPTFLERNGPNIPKSRIVQNQSTNLAYSPQPPTPNPITHITLRCSNPTPAGSSNKPGGCSRGLRQVRRRHGCKVLGAGMGTRRQAAGWPCARQPCR